LSESLECSRRGSGGRTSGQQIRKDAGRDGQPASGEQPGESSSTFRNSAGDGALGPAQLTGHVLAGSTFEVAEHNGQAVFLRQPGKFLVKQSREFTPEVIVNGNRFGHAGERLFVRASPTGDGSRFQGCAVGDSVEPVSNLLRRLDGRCLANQDQERGLESVLGVLLVVQHAPTDAQDHRTMPTDQGLERRDVPRGHVPFQKLPVGRFDVNTQGRLHEAIENGFE
jgi:hypothetical protein